MQFFRDHLTDVIKDHPFFSILFDYVKVQKERIQPSEKGESTGIQVDIEEILFAATDLEDTLRRFGTDHIARFASHHTKFQQFGSYAHNLTSPLSNAHSQLTAFINLVNARIHDVYSTVPTQQELEKNWLPLLRCLDTAYDRIDIFTTNYDLVIETAIQRAGLNLSLGRSTIGYDTLDLPMWGNSGDDSTMSGLLTKLHASLNWTWGDDERTRVDIGSPRHVHSDRQVAIYPGYKGEPTREPFRRFHSYLENRLRQADSVIFIGFAFRDQYLNRVFGRALQPASQRIVVVDPALNEDRLPFEFANGALMQLGFAEAMPDVCTAVGRP